MAAVDEDTSIPESCATDDLAIAARVEPRGSRDTDMAIRWVGVNRRQLWAEALALAERWDSLEPPRNVAVEADTARVDLTHRPDSTYNLVYAWAQQHRSGSHDILEVIKYSGPKHKYEGRIPHAGAARGRKGIESRGLAADDAHHRGCPRAEMGRAGRRGRAHGAPDQRGVSRQHPPARRVYRLMLQQRRVGLQDGLVLCPGNI